MKQSDGRLCKHFRSRKWAAAMVGTGCVLFIYATTLAAVVLCAAEKGQLIVAIANMTVVFMGAITGSLVTGQSFVDWRHGSQSQFVAEERRSEARAEARVFAPKHYDDAAL